MNHNFNSWHPIPRYGLAAAIRYLDIHPTPIMEEEDLGRIITQALSESLNRFMLRPTIKADKAHFIYLPAKEVDPGKKSGQVSANGYYSAPHIITGNNAAGIVKEAKGIIQLLEKGQLTKNYELKRSFAPMIAKMNAGKASMSNPKVDLLKAAFTAYAALTNLKPAAYHNGNTGLFPDIPFYDEKTGSYPILQFIHVFQKLQRGGEGSDSLSSKYDGKNFYRPPIFQGNYHEAPRSMSLGAVPLIAAIGKWVEKQQIQRQEAEQTLQWLAGRPIFSMSDSATSQESFGHHLVKLTLEGELHNVLQHLTRVSLIGVDDGKKYGDTKWKLFLMHFDQFLRFFTRASFQNFLAYRATYPAEFFTLLKTYFMDNQKYKDDIINAAVVYGQAINRAAYLSAKAEDEDDKRKGRASRGLKEYKHRVLLQLESIVQSAKTNAELIARLNAQVGRLTMNDIPSDAQPFLLAAMNEKIRLEDAKHLITAFMRLSPFPSTNTITSDETQEEVSTEADLG
ncbi:hypothetical protein [Phaeodactylibacter xiamenensis]|uniref:hypothetical protein n=1 Tax=Phaeodactylibacter xiamenensis TaxID=1524460 RepID=UPI0024A8CCDA|nr:hypothetical protein [Phaeodactylibacter xiamenensis]